MGSVNALECLSVMVFLILQNWPAISSIWSIFWVFSVKCCEDKGFRGKQNRIITLNERWVRCKVHLTALTFVSSRTSLDLNCEPSWDLTLRSSLWKEYVHDLSDVVFWWVPYALECLPLMVFLMLQNRPAISTIWSIFWVLSVDCCEDDGFRCRIITLSSECAVTWGRPRLLVLSSLRRMSRPDSKMMDSGGSCSQELRKGQQITVSLLWMLWRAVCTLPCFANS